MKRKVKVCDRAQSGWAKYLLGLIQGQWASLEIRSTLIQGTS